MSGPVDVVDATEDVDHDVVALVAVVALAATETYDFRERVAGLLTAAARLCDGDDRDAFLECAAAVFDALVDGPDDSPC